MSASFCPVHGDVVTTVPALACWPASSSAMGSRGVPSLGRVGSLEAGRHQDNTLLDTLSRQPA
jgi:hypothetical protein